MPSLFSGRGAEGWHAPAGRRTCEPRPLVQDGQIRPAVPVGAIKTWDPADRSFRRTTRAASAESEVRPGPRLPTLRPHHLKTGEAGPEALPTLSLPGRKHYPHSPCRIRAHETFVNFTDSYSADRPILSCASLTAPPGSPSLGPIIWPGKGPPDRGTRSMNGAYRGTVSSSAGAVSLTSASHRHACSVWGRSPLGGGQETSSAGRGGRWRREAVRGLEEHLLQRAGQVAAPYQGRRRGQRMMLEADPDHAAGIGRA